MTTFQINSTIPRCPPPFSKVEGHSPDAYLSLVRTDPFRIPRSTFLIAYTEVLSLLSNGNSAWGLAQIGTKCLQRKCWLGIMLSWNMLRRRPALRKARFKKSPRMLSTMFNRYKSLASSCRPIQICKEDSLDGPRIGGSPPDKIVPPVQNSLTRYFATIPLNEAHELSLFLSIDYEEASCTSLWENSVKLHSQQSALVQCVVHPNANRSLKPSLISELSSHAMTIGDECADTIVEPRGALLVPNKIGGRPYFYYDNQPYIDSIYRLFDEGFFYFLQFTCPSAEQAPTGDWPFFEMTFHLLARETPSGITWKYGWG